MLVYNYVLHVYPTLKVYTSYFNGMVLISEYLILTYAPNYTNWVGGRCEIFTNRAYYYTPSLILRKQSKMLDWIGGLYSLHNR